MSNRRGRGDGTIYREPERARWVGQLDLGSGPNGKRIRRKVTGRTKSEVAAKMRALRKAHDGRPGTTGAVRTVGELAEQWMATAVCARHAPDSTMRETYRYIVDHHVLPFVGHLRLNQVSAEDIDRLLVTRAESGYSPATVRRVRNTLSQVFRFGVRRRHCTWDPASFADLPPAEAHAKATPKRRRQPRSLTFDEARQFLDAASDRDDGAVLVVALTTGLRPGELLALSWADLDLETGHVQVHRAWKGHDQHRRIGEPKTRGSIRTVGLPPQAVVALRRHRANQAKARLKGRWPAEWADLVFTSSAGTPIDPANFRRLVSQVAKAAGVGPLAPYDLRHTAASLLSDAGVPNHELADLLGHTTTRMVEVHYRHRLAESVDVAVAPMARLLGESTA